MSLFLSDARRDAMERAAIRRYACVQCSAAPACEREPATCPDVFAIVEGRSA